MLAVAPLIAQTKPAAKHAQAHPPAKAEPAPTPTAKLGRGREALSASLRQAGMDGDQDP